MTVDSYYDTLKDNEGKLNEFKADLKDIFQSEEVKNILFNIGSYKHVAGEHVADSYYHNVLTQEAKTDLTNYFPKKDNISKNYQPCLSDACCYIAWTIIANKLDSEKNQITGYHDSYFYDEKINTEIKNGQLDFSNQKIDIDEVIEKSFHNSSDAYEKYLVKGTQEKPGNGVEVTPSATGLTKILSCSDFITVYNSNDNNQSKQKLANLLNKYEDFNYRTIKESVESSTLSPENKKIVFAEVLPNYNFKVCSEFDSTWDMFKDGYIDFDTLVTKFWDRENFDQGQNNKDQQNVFRDFASKYTKYAGYNKDNMGDSKSSTENMINGLRQKGVMADNDTQNLKDQIDNAADVGVFGIIIQFLSNFFSKGKTAFKPIQQTKQDKVISNLKPLSGLLRQAAQQHRDGSDKLI